MISVLYNALNTVLGRLTAGRADNLDQIGSGRMAKLDTLESRLTSGRAGNLDQIGSERMAKLDTLESRLTAARALEISTAASDAAAVNARLHAAWAAYVDALYGRLTQARADNLDKLDANLSTRAPLATALSNAIWTNNKAGYLDMPVSGVAPGNANINYQVYTSSATFSVTANIYKVFVMAVGGGGNGAANGTNWSGGGGGGGGFSFRSLLTAPGTAYAVTVGGAAGNSVFGDNLVVAYGGSHASGNNGGAGGVVGIGDIKFAGGRGGDSYSTINYGSGGGGGAAGCMRGKGGAGANGANTYTGGSGGSIAAFNLGSGYFPFSEFSGALGLGGSSPASGSGYGGGVFGGGGGGGGNGGYGGGGGGGGSGGSSGYAAGTGGQGIVLVFW